MKIKDILHAFRDCEGNLGGGCRRSGTPHVKTRQKGSENATQTSRKKLAKNDDKLQQVPVQ